MNKLKMLALTALAAATLGTGALAAAPSASAQRPDCSEISRQSRINYNVWKLLVATGYGQTRTAADYRWRSDSYDSQLLHFC